MHDGFFSVHFSADSCMLNLLYGINKLPCKIDQRELEMKVMTRLTYNNFILLMRKTLD